MMSIAKVTVLGHIGKDAEMKYTPDGKAVANFTVAVSDGKESTTWYKVVCWEKQAEVANEKGNKGTTVFVEGKLKMNEWEDNAGTKRITPEVTASTVVFLK